MLKRLKRFTSELIEEDSWLSESKLDPLSAINPQFDIYSNPLNYQTITDRPVSTSTSSPTLKHGLSKIVRQQGIFPASQFPPIVQKVPKINSISYQRFLTYVRPSQDQTLISKAKENKAKFFSGSSSVTSSLQQIYYAITNYKSPDITGLGQGFNLMTMNYMAAHRKPNAFFLRKHEGNIYSIESDKGPCETKNLDVLLTGGTVLENLFVLEQEEFERITDENKEIDQGDLNKVLENSKSFKFRMFGNMMIRSQIDCQADDGSFVYEIKTRACAPIRYDLENYQDYLDYKINQRKGVDQSFEREYFDLIRSILIKYFFQIKIGNMDGAFIAYHNTQEFFGFEYISLSEMEKRLFGSSEVSLQLLQTCFSIFQDILEEITEKFAEYDFMKIGIFANYLNNELMITVEPHEKVFEYPEDPRITKTFTHEIDYYNRYFPGTVPYVLCRKIFPYINGILQKDPVFLEPGDEFKLRQLKYSRGTMSYYDYMYFLLNAYKSDSFTKHSHFVGSWKRYNDFHVYRKAIYKTIN